MEDEGFVDDSFIEEAAWEYVSLHGRESVALLLRLAGALPEPLVALPVRVAFAYRKKKARR